MSDLLEVRTIKPADFEQYANLSSFTFGVSVESERKLLDLVNPEQILVAKFDREIVAQLFIHHLGVWLNGKLFPLGGIGGVTTADHHRQKGYATVLLQKTLGHMRDILGYTMSALYPTTYSLYHNCGWTIADKGCLFTAAPTAFRLANKTSNYRVEQRTLQSSDIPILQSIRHRFAVITHGLIERDDLGWRLRILEQFSARPTSRKLVLHYNEQQKEDGYLIYEVRGNILVEVVEFIYNSPEAFDGLLSFISEYIQQPKVSLWLNAETPLFDKVINPLDFQITYDPLRQAMFRIVDVTKALSGRPIINSEISGTFTLQIMDSMAKWNDGLWRIEIEKGNVQCRKLDNTSIDSDAILDIQALTQLFIGYSTIDNAVASGLIRVNCSRALSLLKAFFESKSFPFSGERF